MTRSYRPQVGTLADGSNARGAGAIRTRAERRREEQRLLRQVINLSTAVSSLGAALPYRDRIDETMWEYLIKTLRANHEQIGNLLNAVVVAAPPQVH